VPFEGVSTAREAYTPKELEPRPQSGAVEYRPSGIPFSGTTEMREQFK
jgi:hypothetical protein